MEYNLPIDLPSHLEDARKEGPVLASFEGTEFLWRDLFHAVFNLVISALLSELGCVSRCYMEDESHTTWQFRKVLLRTSSKGALLA